jgi:hypothetical protein
LIAVALKAPTPKARLAALLVKYQEAQGSLASLATAVFTTRSTVAQALFGGSGGDLRATVGQLESLQKLARIRAHHLLTIQEACVSAFAEAGEPQSFAVGELPQALSGHRPATNEFRRAFLEARYASNDWLPYLDGFFAQLAPTNLTDIEQHELVKQALTLQTDQGILPRIPERARTDWETLDEGMKDELTERARVILCSRPYDEVAREGVS